MAYRVAASREAREQARQVLIEAHADGEQGRFREALAKLHEQIAEAPHTRGELKYRLPTGRPVYSASNRPAAVNYAVYDTEEVVIITKVARLGS